MRLLIIIAALLIALPANAGTPWRKTSITNAMLKRGWAGYEQRQWRRSHMNWPYNARRTRWVYPPR